MLKSCFTNRLLLISAVSAVAVMACAGDVEAQNQQQQQQQQQRQQQQQQPSDLLTTPPETLKQKVSCPNLPEYTGKSKFINGLVYKNWHDPKSKQGPAYVMCFNAKETPEQVHDWWLNSMRQYRWNITYSSSDVVRGVDKDGSNCSVQTSGPVLGFDKDDRSSYVVRFQGKD